MNPLRILALAALVAVVARADPGPVDLFDGKDLSGWSFVTLKHATLEQVAHVTPSGALAATGKPTGYLVAPGGPYANYRLHVEYRWVAPKGNSGVFVHISSGPVGGKVWPRCLQVQNHDQHTGELIPMGGLTFTGGPADGKIYAMRQPPHEEPIGEWNVCDIVCNGDTIQVTVNGVVQNQASGLSNTSGRIGLQLEGYPFEVRALRLTPL